MRGYPQSEEENAKTYAESQQQRALERKLRAEKRDLEVLKAQGADADAINAQKARARKASSDLDKFCDETGRHRRKSREYTPIKASFPDKENINPAEFPTDVKEQIDNWFRR